MAAAAIILALTFAAATLVSWTLLASRETALTSGLSPEDILGPNGGLLSTATEHEFAGKPRPFTPFDGDPFSAEYVADEPYDTVFNPEFAARIGYGNAKVPIPETKSLRAFAAICEEAGVLFAPFFGSSLHYARTKSNAPYDHDIDVIISSKSISKLLPYVSRFPFANRENDPEKRFMWLQPYADRVFLRDRASFNCDGVWQQKQRDFCSAWGPVGRLQLGGTGRRYNKNFIDIWALDYVPNSKYAVYHDYHSMMIDASIIFPLRPCTFMGFKMVCVNDLEQYARNEYGNSYARLSPWRAPIFGFWAPGWLHRRAPAHIISEWLVERLNKKKREIYGDEEMDREIPLKLKRRTNCEELQKLGFIKGFPIDVIHCPHPLSEEETERVNLLPGWMFDSDRAKEAAWTLSKWRREVDYK